MTDEKLIIELEKPDSFDCREGNFSLKLDDVKLKPEAKDGEITNMVRLVFEVNDPDIKHKRILAGRNFHPSSKQFRQFLESWLGERLYEALVDGGLDAKKLIGTQGEAVIVHRKNKHFKKPYVSIEEIYPPGTLILTEAFKEKGSEI